MKSKSTRAGLIFISLALIFLSTVLFFVAKSTFETTCEDLAAGSSIGPYAVAGAVTEVELTAAHAILNAPVDLFYRTDLIRFDPKASGIAPDVTIDTTILTETRNAQCSTQSFLNSLFRKVVQKPIHLEVVCSADIESIKNYLITEIQPRYDQPAAARQPDPSGNFFISGHDGRLLDIERSAQLIAEAICSFEDRTAVLIVQDIPESDAGFANLEIMLRSLIDQNQDKDQVTEIFLIDPSTGNQLNFARRNKTDLPPNIAFTAASTIKIPVLISSFLRLDEEPGAFTKRQMEMMITESKNDQTDWLMENVVGSVRAPLIVTEEMHKLGLENSFLAGYFYLGAPLLDLVKTAANQRSDINLKPDIYNQTTAKDIGTLLFDLYNCEKDGTGKLFEVFPGQITQHECASMIELLKNNRLPYLITAGIPDGVPIAHKHGWIEESDGLLHTMSNVAAVYSPAGDYILSIFTYHPTNLIFENGNRLFSRLSTAIYNYFNPLKQPK